MIDGIRIAPHVLSLRRESRVSGSGAQAHYLDCGECQTTVDEPGRRSWNCGFLPRSPESTGAYPLPLAAPRPTCDTCPGFLIQLPEVMEAFHLHLWWEKGELGERVRRRGASPHLEHYIDTVTGALADLDLERERKREEERRDAERRR